MPHRRSIVATTLITVAITLTILLSLEGLSRILLTVRADLSSQEPDWYQYASNIGWERRPYFKGLVGGERHGHDSSRYLRQFDAQGFFAEDTPQIHDRAHKRILAIGDSNTFGWGVPTRNAFPEVLDDLREDADVINLGVSGYTSFQGMKPWPNISPRFSLIWLLRRSASTIGVLCPRKRPSTAGRSSTEKRCRISSTSFVKNSTCFESYRAWYQNYARISIALILWSRSMPATPRHVSRRNNTGKTWSALHDSVGNGRCRWFLSCSRITPPILNTCGPASLT